MTSEQKDKIWYWWHNGICFRSAAGMQCNLSVSRTKYYFWKAIHKLQLPICRWLDKWSHSK